MKRKLVTVSVAIAALAVGVTAASATTTVIGGAGQSTTQGVNNQQSGLNGDVGGSTFIIGKSAPTETQTALNTVNHTQAIGGGGATATLIANGAGACFCQSSNGGVNNSQIAVNGDGGGTITAILADSTPALTQAVTNSVRGSQSIGSGSLLAGDSVVIGAVGQANTEGVNDAQSGRNGTAGSGPVFVTGASAPSLSQTVCNDLSNITVLGGAPVGVLPACLNRG